MSERKERRTNRALPATIQTEEREREKIILPNLCSHSCYKDCKNLHLQVHSLLRLLTHISLVSVSPFARKVTLLSHFPTSRTYNSTVARLPSSSPTFIMRVLTGLLGEYDHSPLVRTFAETPVCMQSLPTFRSVIVESFPLHRHRNTSLWPSPRPTPRLKEQHRRRRQQQR